MKLRTGNAHQVVMLCERMSCLFLNAQTRIFRRKPLLVFAGIAGFAEWLTHAFPENQEKFFSWTKL